MAERGSSLFLSSLVEIIVSCRSGERNHEQCRSRERSRLRVEFPELRDPFEFLSALTHTRARADRTCLPRVAARIRWIRHLKQFPSTVSTQNCVKLRHYAIPGLFCTRAICTPYFTYTYITFFPRAMLNLF